jgi:hypothetical protein
LGEVVSEMENSNKKKRGLEGKVNTYEEELRGEED